MKNMKNQTHKLLTTLTLFTVLGTAAACSPTVRVETPDKPITINLNVNISHEIRVRVDKDLENTFDKNSSIF